MWGVKVTSLVALVPKEDMAPITVGVNGEKSPDGAPRRSDANRKFLLHRMLDHGSCITGFMDHARVAARAREPEPG